MPKQKKIRKAACHREEKANTATTLANESMCPATRSMTRPMKSQQETGSDGRRESQQRNESSTGSECTVAPLTTDDIPSIVLQVVSAVRKDAPPDNRPLGPGMYVHIYIYIELAMYVAVYVCSIYS